MTGLILGWDKKTKRFYVESHGKRLKEFGTYVEAMRYYNKLEEGGNDGQH